MKKTNFIKSKKFVTYTKKNLVLMKMMKKTFRLYHKVRDHCHFIGKYRGAAYNICNLRYRTPKEILVVFHNGSTYDHHFIVNELAKKCQGQFECLGENTVKYTTFSEPIQKELDNGKTVAYKLRFIDSFRFMSSSLSSLVDNLKPLLKDVITKNVKNISLVLSTYQLKMMN